MHIVLPIFYKNALEGFIVAYYNALLKLKNFELIKWIFYCKFIGNWRGLKVSNYIVFYKGTPQIRG